MSNILESLNRGLETKYFSGILDEAVYGGAKWSNLSDEERQKCLDADPTYKGKEDSAGKYSEWILKIYSGFKKNHPNEEFRFEHCKDVLTQFMRSKENLKDTSKKDILQFNSLDDLDSFLNNSQNFKNTFVEVPKNETSIRGARKIFENNRCEIWVPLTHEASREIAGEPKTRWCTAYSNPYNYNDYAKQGPLFILIMKDNSGEMYQFHFERKAAMNKYDHWVRWEDFPEMQSQEVKNFREEYFREKDEATCKRIDKLLQEPGVSTGELRDLIRNLHDKNLPKKYLKEVDKVVCQQIDELLRDPDVSVKEVNNLIHTLHDKELSDKCLKKTDRAICARIDSLLKKEPSGVIPESNLEKAKELIGQLHDEDLKLTYSEAVNENCLEQFYANLTPVLNQNSFSIKYLRAFTSKADVVLPSSVKKLGDECFRGCTSLKSVVIPNGVTSIGTSAFRSCSSLESVVIPDSVTSIKDYAFCGCDSLTDVRIPDSVTSIAGSAFYYCSSLKSIAIPNSVTSIGSSAFYGCLSLKSIAIPNSVTSIGEYAFYGCRSLKSVEIGGGVTSIRDCVFHGCSSLESIVIPNSVTSIEICAFFCCPSLKDVYYSGSQENRKHLRIQAENDAILNATWHGKDGVIEG